VKVRLIFDWGLHNLALLPTVIVGRGTERGAGWVYVYWLRGRLGASRY
jgi:hypothetical protein